MPEYFVMTNSFAAPFFSDQDTFFQEAESPEAALEAVAASYTHPAGLYSAAVYADATAYHKNADPLARWLCNKELALQEATEGLSGYSVYSPNQDSIEINGKPLHIENPREGRVVPVT